MKLLLQRVTQAEVTVEDRSVGCTDAGLLVLVGLSKADAGKKADAGDWDKAIEKVLTLRLFADEQGKMNRSLEDVRGGLLLVSQFTLAGDCSKGKRPSFDSALAPEEARLQFAALVARFKEKTSLKVATGEFGASMQVSLINNGPGTFMLEF
jgi:D-aminoacyl-tRNA deacylase